MPTALEMYKEHLRTISKDKPKIPATLIVKRGPDNGSKETMRTYEVPEAWERHPHLGQENPARP